jgi:starch synthase
MLPGIKKNDVEMLETPDFFNISKMALNQSDGIIFGSDNLPQEIIDYAKSLKKPLLEFKPAETMVNEYANFYETLI